MLLADVALLLHPWDQSLPLVLALCCRARGSRGEASVLGSVLSGGDVWKKRGEHRAGKGRSNAKRNQMESTGKSEDVLAGRMETSRLDGGMVKKLEKVQLSSCGRSEFVSELRVLRWEWMRRFGMSGAACLWRLSLCARVRTECHCCLYSGLDAWASHEDKHTAQLLLLPSQTSSSLKKIRWKCSFHPKKEYQSQKALLNPYVKVCITISDQIANTNFFPKGVTCGCHWDTHQPSPLHHWQRPHHSQPSKALSKSYLLTPLQPKNKLQHHWKQNIS